MTNLLDNPNFIKNLSGVSKKSVELARLLKESPVSGTVSMNNRKELVVFDHGEPALNHIAPAAEALKRTETIRKTPPEILMIIGCAPVYHLQAILSSPSYQGKICLFEPDVTLLKNVLAQIDISQIFNDSRIFLAQSHQEMKRFLWQNYKHQDRVEIFSLPFYRKYYSQIVNGIASILHEEMLQSSVSHLTQTFNAKFWVEYSLRNLKNIATQPDLENIRNKFLDIPVAVIGAGPSLNDAIPFLQKYQNCVLIITVDTALRSLIKNNIFPHIVCILESNDFSWRSIKECGYQNIAILATDTTNPQIFTVESRKKITVFLDTVNSSREMSSLLQRSMISACGTVSTIAFNVALVSGANPIFLFGQDLSFTKESRYAKNSLFDNETMMEKYREIQQKDAATLTLKEKIFINHENILSWYDSIEQRKERARIFTLEERAFMSSMHGLSAGSMANTVTCIDVEGKTKFTTNSYKSCARWFGLQAKQIAESSNPKKLYNVSNGQILEGFEVIRPHAHEKLAELIPLESKDIWSILEPSLVEIKGNWNEVMQWIDQKLQEGSILLEIAKDGKKAASQVLKCLDSPKDNVAHWLEKLKSANIRFDESIHKSQIWSFYFLKEISEFESAENRRNKTSKDIIKDALKFYETLFEGTSYLVGLLKDIENDKADQRPLLH